MAKRKKRTPQYTQGMCSVCALLNNDTDIKTVRYCSICKEWICKRHWSKYGDRAKAAWKKITK